MNSYLVPSAILLLLIGFIWGLLAMYWLIIFGLRQSDKHEWFWHEFVKRLSEKQFDLLMNASARRFVKGKSK